MASKFTIVQVGKEEVKFQFYINQMRLEVPVSGGTYTFDDRYLTDDSLGDFEIVSLNGLASTGFTISTSEPWITVNNNFPFSFTITPNDSFYENLGAVKLIQDGSNDKITILIHQKGIEEEQPPVEEKTLDFIVAGEGGFISKVKVPV